MKSPMAPTGASPHWMRCACSASCGYRFFACKQQCCQTLACMAPLLPLLCNAGNTLAHQQLLHTGLLMPPRTIFWEQSGADACKPCEMLPGSQSAQVLHQPLHLPSAWPAVCCSNVANSTTVQCSCPHPAAAICLCGTEISQQTAACIHAAAVGSSQVSMSLASCLLSTDLHKAMGAAVCKRSAMYLPCASGSAARGRTGCHPRSRPPP